MKKLATYGAVASIFLLTAGPAALAQNYNPSYGQNQNYGQNPSYGQDTNQSWNRSSSDWNRGGSDWNRSGMSNQGWRQGGWDQGRGSWGQGSGSSQQSGSQLGGSQQSGMRNRDLNGPSAQDAWQELSKYGYKNIGGMERSEGWQARAVKNGERVFVFIDDDGTIATYRGNGQ
jgi:hypothetical protein